MSTWSNSGNASVSTWWQRLKEIERDLLEQSATTPSANTAIEPLDLTIMHASSVTRSSVNASFSELHHRSYGHRWSYKEYGDTETSASER